MAHDSAHGGPHADPSRPLPRAPILAPPGAPPAMASRPDTGLDDTPVHGYESNPAPWWIGVLWLAFFVFGAAYLILNLLRS